MTEKDRSMVRKDGTWFSRFFFKKGIRTTLLEWNEFEDDLKVKTDNEQEARYILTPDFMITLHEWWLLKKQKIKVSFISDHMYLMIPLEKIVIGLGNNHKNFHLHYQYLESLMLSIWYVQQLTEGLPRQLSSGINQRIV